MLIKLGGDEFWVDREMIDVTMLNRPDTTWRFIDQRGHEHRWFVKQADGTLAPAGAYRPLDNFELPTLDYIVDEEATDEYPEVGHYECRECRETIKPRACADTSRQLIPGIATHYINGEVVSQEEFERRVREAGATF